MQRRPLSCLLTFGILLACFFTTVSCEMLAKPPTAHVSPGPYRLVPGDEVALTFFGEPSLSGTYRISASGHLSLPLAGEVDAAGATLPELHRQVLLVMQDGFLVDPDLVVELASPQPVYLLGEVRQPGEFEYLDGLTLSQAIAKAGGYTHRANRRRVYILHHGESEEMTYQARPSLSLAPGDTVRIGQRFL